MSAQHDPEAISAQLHRFVRANMLDEGAAFETHSPLAEAGLDSFSLVELLLFSERAFGVIVPESHLTRENLATLDSLARCIASLAAAPQSPPPAAAP